MMIVRKRILLIAGIANYIMSLKIIETGYAGCRKKVKVAMIKGRKVYDPLTGVWSTGYWIRDDKGNYYPVWVEDREPIKFYFERNQERNSQM